MDCQVCGAQAAYACTRTRARVCGQACQRVANRVDARSYLLEKQRAGGLNVLSPDEVRRFVEELRAERGEIVVYGDNDSGVPVFTFNQLCNPGPFLRALEPLGKGKHGEGFGARVHTVDDVAIKRIKPYYLDKVPADADNVLELKFLELLSRALVETGATPHLPFFIDTYTCDGRDANGDRVRTHYIMTERAHHGSLLSYLNTQLAKPEWRDWQRELRSDADMEAFLSFLRELGVKKPNIIDRIRERLETRTHVTLYLPAQENQKRPIFNVWHTLDREGWVVSFEPSLQLQESFPWLEAKLNAFFPARVWDSLFRQLIFEQAYNFALLQRAFPGFSHNDIHLGNILAQVGPYSGYTRYALNDAVHFGVRNSGVRSMLWDFDLSNIPDMLENSYAHFLAVFEPVWERDPHQPPGQDLALFVLYLMRLWKWEQNLSRDFLARVEQTWGSWIFQVAPVTINKKPHFQTGFFWTPDRVQKAPYELLLTSPLFDPLREPPKERTIHFRLERALDAQSIRALVNQMWRAPLYVAPKVPLFLAMDKLEPRAYVWTPQKRAWLQHTLRAQKKEVVVRRAQINTHNTSSDSQRALRTQLIMEIVLNLIGPTIHEDMEEFLFQFIYHRQPGLPWLWINPKEFKFKLSSAERIEATLVCAWLLDERFFPWSRLR